jgi:hypothetical protein
MSEFDYHDDLPDDDPDLGRDDLLDSSDRSTVAVAPPAAPVEWQDEPAAPIVLDALQEAAIDMVEFQLYTNISGTAGVGKTVVAKEILSQYVGVMLAATTGIAAVNLGEGTTINALLKYFDLQNLKHLYMTGGLQAQIRRLQRAGVQRILIDEKSMLSGPALTLITRAVHEVNSGEIESLAEVGQTDDEIAQAAEHKVVKEKLPPIGITLIGDFGQLPPVPDKDPKTGKNLPVEFAFDSPEWGRYAANTVVLTKIFRQDDQPFVSALHAVRAGRIVDALRFFSADKFSATVDDDFEGTTVFAKNEEVDRYNLLRLDRLHTPPMVAKSVRWGVQRPDWKNIPETLSLKEGALVMLLANRRRSPKHGTDAAGSGKIIYANGDLATLVGKDESGAWVVRLQRTGEKEVVAPVDRENVIPLTPGRRKEIKAEIKMQMEFQGQTVPEGINFDADTPDDLSYLAALTTIDDDTADSEIGKKLTKENLARMEFQRRLAGRISDDGKGKMEIIGGVTYMPLRAAYGCTVHKTQGLTLDRVQINLDNYFFKQPGMLFVALSRARTAEGLRIVGNQQMFADRCRIEPRVQRWL